MGTKLAKKLTDRIPKPQKVQWVASTPDGPGVRVWSDVDTKQKFVTWPTLQTELVQQLLPLLLQDPAGFRFEVRDLKTKKNWLVQLIDPEGTPYADLWLGGNPEAQGAFDGLIRIGGGAPGAAVVWQTYQRLSDGTYRRLPSKYWNLELVPATDRLPTVTVAQSYQA